MGARSDPTFVLEKFAYAVSDRKNGLRRLARGPLRFHELTSLIRIPGLAAHNTRAQAHWELSQQASVFFHVFFVNVEPALTFFSTSFGESDVNYLRGDFNFILWSIFIIVFIF